MQIYRITMLEFSFFHIICYLYASKLNKQSTAMNEITKRTGILLILFLSAATLLAQGTNQKYLDYIEKYKMTAISEMSRTGIPASIKLAQAILESNAGQSTLARKAKNHFGIKCGPAWHGKKFHLEDDDYDEYGNKIKSCFRVYKNPVSSFIAHSEFLRDPRKSYRYGPLFSLNPLDYQAWAFGLKEAGYATSPRYPQMLIKLIEDYDLSQYDHADDIVYDDTDTDNPDIPSTSGKVKFGRVGKINDLKVFVAKGGESVYQVAFRNDIKLKRLLKYNKAVQNGEQKLPAGYKLFLQPKRNNWRGRAAYHYVKKGETLFDISQKYGVRLKKLRRKNRLPEHAEPLVGERIRIRGWHRRREVVRYKLVNTPEVPPLGLDTNKDGAPDQTKPKPTNGDLLDIEISPSDEDKDEILIDVEPSTTENDPEADVPKPTETVPDSEKPVVDTIAKDKPVILDDTPIMVDESTIDEPDTTTESPDDVPVVTHDAPPAADAPTYITIIKGDTLYSLARAFGLTVAELKAMNGLKSNNLKIGQKLRVR